MGETLFRDIVRAIPVEPLPDLSEAVLRQLPSARKKPGLLSWLWQPRAFSLQLRPAYAFGVIALLAFGLTVRGPRKDTHVAAATPVFVQFRLDAPNARAVSLAGDFTKWQPSYKLTRTQPGVWTVIVPLHPGVHDYAFIVDGVQWTPDPMAPAVQDGFGGLNSRLALLAPEQRSM